jgi:putative membrane protein
MKFLIRLVISALAFAAAEAIVPGIRIAGFGTLLIAALVWGVVNAVVKPILIVLTLPVTIVTLGLFILIINAALFGLTAWLLPGFQVDGLGDAFLGWIIVSLVSWIASRILRDDR